MTEAKFKSTVVHNLRVNTHINADKESCDTVPQHAVLQLQELPCEVQNNVTGDSQMQRHGNGSCV